ncbi:c-type cytochrome biogenesis protein CcmI [Sneathiella sp. P13V-1]|uniref:c-type cytochrome biogenesis protein CcmI n=1 Tax=Sneathiella sp. P13V-1 TaxID=2697366 RepID=UPI0039EF9047
MIWVVLAVISLVAAAFLVYPFFFGNKDAKGDQELGLELYKTQLQELEKDVKDGVTSEEAAAPIRLEIQRRILRTSRLESGSQKLISSNQIALAGFVFVVLLVGSFGLYWDLGSPNLPAKPLASRDLDAEREQLVGDGQDMQVLVKRLAERLQEQPDNLDGWVLLARSLSRMGRYEDAANTFLQATKLEPNDPNLYIGAGENFYFLADRFISEASLSAFKKAEDIAPRHPGVRFYMALYELQSGREDMALQLWIDLYKDSDPSDAFIPVLKGQITQLADKLGQDVAGLFEQEAAPSTGMPALSREDREMAAEMSAADRQDMIKSMVARLAERMEEEPEFDGLMRLGRSYGTLGELQKSAVAYGKAAELKPTDPMPLIMQALALVQDAPREAPPPQEAIQIYKKVLAMDDTIAEAHWYVGLDAAIGGRKEEALSHWQKILPLVPVESPLHKNVTNAIKSLSEGS